MKFRHLLLFAILSIWKIQAQTGNEWMYSEGSLEGFVPDSVYYTFVSDANLRETPGTDSKVITRLPIATPVTVESVSEVTYSQRGLTLPWVRIRATTANSQPVTGFIWGGFLALATIVTPEEEYMPNRGVIYLTGLSGYNETEHKLTIQVRLALAGKELAKTEFTSMGNPGYYPAFEVDYPPFEGLNAIVKVNYYYPACGHPSGNNLLFWQKSGQLSRVLETTSVSDGGVFYDSEEMILPSDKGGIGEHILVTRDISEFDDTKDDLTRTSQTISITLYKWTGTKLTKVREIK